MSNDFSWVKEWRKKYRERGGQNAKSGGTLSECVKRMSDIFIIDNTLTKDLIEKATDYYFSVKQKDYIMQPHYFLWKYPYPRTPGDDKIYPVLSYLELYLELKEEEKERAFNFSRNKMN